MTSPTLANLERNLSRLLREEKEARYAAVGASGWARGPNMNKWNKHRKIYLEVLALKRRIANKRERNAAAARHAAVRRHWGAARRVMTMAGIVQALRREAWRPPVQGGSAYRSLAARTLVGRPSTRNVGTSTSPRRRSPNSPRRRSPNSPRRRSP